MSTLAEGVFFDSTVSIHDFTVIVIVRVVIAVVDVIIVVFIIIVVVIVTAVVAVVVVLLVIVTWSAVVIMRLAVSFIFVEGIWKVLLKALQWLRVEERLFGGVSAIVVATFEQELMCEQCDAKCVLILRTVNIS